MLSELRTLAYKRNRLFDNERARSALGHHGSKGSNFLARARGFLGAAEKLANDPQAFAPAVMLLIWQASELALKALSVDHSIKFSHDLKELMDPFESQ